MIEWIMLGAFILALGLSVWKLYLFFPNKQLPDDDTTPESVDQLIRIMIAANRPGMSETELYEAMLIHPDFNAEHFWRFNPNRLRQLITHHRFSDPQFRL